jgi:diacylglycerol kinase (ATP)
MQVAMLFNPISGTGRALATAERLRDELTLSGFKVRLIPTERRDPALWLRPKLNGCDAAIIAGGDGAVRLAVTELSRASVPLWHAPCGTENLFARAFGMTRKSDDIARALVGRKTRAIDLGTVVGGDLRRNGESATSEHAESFAIMGSIGFDADVVHALDACRTGGISHFSYVGPVQRCLTSWSPATLRWTIDGESEELGRGMVVVGNMPEYGVRLNPTRDAEPTDGLLDAVFLPANSAWELALWVPLLRCGLHTRLAPARSGFRMRRGALVEVWTSKPTLLQLDGDPSRAAAAEGRVFRALQGVLPVLLPASGI